jgi:hypothetical protein
LGVPAPVMQDHPKADASAPQKKGTAMPVRRPPFENLSILESVSQVLDAQPGLPQHADVITRTIFDVKTAKQLQAAKRSVVSEIVRGIQKKNLFKRVAKNTFIKVKGIESLKMAG